VSNFWQRTLSGAVFITAIILSIWYGPLSFQALFMAIAMASLDEFYRLIRTGGFADPFGWFGLPVGFLLYLIIAFDSLLLAPLRWEAIVYPAFGLMFFAELYRKKENPFSNIAFGLLGVLYTVLPFALLSRIALHGGTYQHQLLLGYFLLIWTSDTFAYLTGRKLGRTKLFERISPGKTWEGSTGGAIATILLAYGLWRWYPEPGLHIWMFMALIIVVSGTLGDLSESLLKRSIGVKDSGSFMPGHGGFLDRFDAVLLSAPFVWALISLT
jgi:phosphatidate cytidylyltransferase